ncbi:hypothetical protein [Dickeya sp. NCPPB 3274]|uniref:hypothetical protein n=1 Tax=Dickeya sp. NCPPB 3274 TaxID=568766 RepID=UPI0005B43FA1|nr:hypothetical protein [Dickeya sp. NCPPB 3274]
MKDITDFLADTQKYQSEMIFRELEVTDSLTDMSNTIGQCVADISRQTRSSYWGEHVSISLDGSQCLMIYLRGLGEYRIEQGEALAAACNRMKRLASSAQFIQMMKCQ